MKSDVSFEKEQISTVKKHFIQFTTNFSAKNSSEFLFPCLVWRGTREGATSLVLNDITVF